MARKKSMPFEEAREFIQTQCIGSRKQYQEWYDANRPKLLPKYPNRAYQDVWTSWNDFLGTNNKFDNEKRSYRPFLEAVAWAHKQNIAKYEDWLTYCQVNRDTMPADIPSRPDLIYDDWLSWMHWLGNRPREMVEAQQKIVEESAIFYVIQESEYASQSTVFTFGVEKGGISALRDNWEMSRNFKVIKMFYYDDKEMESVQRLIDRQSTAYYGASKIRIVPNINQLVWDISSHLMIAQVR